MFRVNTQWYGIKGRTVALLDEKERCAAFAKWQSQMVHRKLRSTFTCSQEIGLAGGSWFDLWCPLIEPGFLLWKQTPKMDWAWGTVLKRKRCRRIVGIVASPVWMHADRPTAFPVSGATGQTTSTECSAETQGDEGHKKRYSTGRTKKTVDICQVLVH